jgi:hypothetical protein
MNDIVFVKTIDMETKLLLNFPKIRNLTQSLEILIDALKEMIQTNPQCNFELNQEATGIRKRDAQKNGSV